MPITEYCGFSKKIDLLNQVVEWCLDASYFEEDENEEEWDALKTMKTFNNECYLAYMRGNF